MRGLRHVASFARYWNRPMDRDWASLFWFELAYLIVMCGQGGAYPLIGITVFGLVTGTWTQQSLRGYRRGKRAGDRSRTHDRNDIWKDRWPR